MLATAAAVLAMTAFGPAPATGPQTTMANRQLQVAAAYWGTTPACGPVTIIIDPALRATTGHMAEAGDDCKITTMPIGDPLLGCTLDVHEYGHLLGRTHSLDPTDIMFGGWQLRAPLTCVHHWRSRWTCHATQCYMARLWRPFKP
jgi:hypothetical protein